jgi:hypothetical protein
MLDLIKNIDKNEPLTHKILYDPKSPIPQLLARMYSLESFLYGTLNYATRFKDQSKIDTLGPYVVAMGYVLAGVCRERKDLNEETFKGVSLYRGSSLTDSQI